MTMRSDPPPLRLLDQLRQQIRVLHYSIRTEQAYVHWVRAFVRFHGLQHPSDLGGDAVQAFLTWLAAEQQVSVSTHKQALSALLFLYQKVLRQRVPWLDEVSRPQRAPRLPVVLSQDEVARVLGALPVEHRLIEALGWQPALWVLAGAVLLILPLALGLREPPAPASGPRQGAWAALREAAAYPSFRWLTAGYFVCGFQVVFIGVHLPAYLQDRGLSAQVGTTALALIGLFNVFGTYAAGALGQRLPRRHILAFIYAARAVAITAFITVPLSPASVYVLAAVMGLLWLSTIPPTNATVAQIFGVTHLSMLGGLVFFSHQIGSFVGVWLGGLLFDRTGSYDLVWWIAIALGVLAALANLPIREHPLQRTQAQAA